MKVRLNLTIDRQVLAEMKDFSDKKNTSLSKLIEEYFKSVIKKKKKSDLLNLVDALPAHNIPSDMDLKAIYHSEKNHSNE